MGAMQRQIRRIRSCLKPTLYRRTAPAIYLQRIVQANTQPLPKLDVPDRNAP